MDLKNRLIQLERERDELRERVSSLTSSLNDLSSSKVKGEVSLTTHMDTIRQVISFFFLPLTFANEVYTFKIKCSCVSASKCFI